MHSQQYFSLVQLSQHGTEMEHITELTLEVHFALSLPSTNIQQNGTYIAKKFTSCQVSSFMLASMGEFYINRYKLA